MDWNLKAPCWDEANTPNIETMNDEPSTLFGELFSVDLKLGHHEVGNSASDSLVVPKSKIATSSSASSGLYNKRARAINQAVSCLVDGCNSDLSACRDYHRRHKVCEQHSKTPVVTINGLKQRFCQQCSRFHSLEQFDEGKRSCRKRLDGHNRRRRKTAQPEHVTRPASYLNNYQGSFSGTGTQLVPFSCPYVYSPTALATPASLQDHNQQRLHFLGTSPSTHNKMFSDGGSLAANSVYDSSRALSLLSSSSSRT